MKPMMYKKLGLILIAVILCISTASAATLSTAQFGAYSQNLSGYVDGNPIGGGKGYTDIYIEGNASITNTSTNAAQFIAALAVASPGNVIFIPSNATIDLSGVWTTQIPTGVVVASDRGYAGSSGGRILGINTNNPTNLMASTGTVLNISGDNVRITGLRIEGLERDHIRHPSYEGVVGIFNNGNSGIVIDNNEISGFGYAGVIQRSLNTAAANTSQQTALTTPEIGSGLMNVHHNYIHHCQIVAQGYGVVIIRGSALVKGNIFDYTRHAIASTDGAWVGYEATYNLYLSHAFSHVIDVHASGSGGVNGTAGNTFRIQYNTIRTNTSHAIYVRGVPRNDANISFNDINNCHSVGNWWDLQPGFEWYEGGLCWGDVPNAVQTYYTLGNISMSNNLIDGLYVPGSQILVENAP
jgi:hypothetical protein